ncbi:MAG: hypothetical protein ABIY55_13990 [Kofleriaceae bacterium]
MRWSLVIVVAGCATPAPKQNDHPWVPPDDEQRSVTWRASHPPAPAEYTFAWDQVRASNEKWLSVPPTQPCDPRHKGLQERGVECLHGSGGKLEIAALDINTRPGVDSHHIQIVIDRGADATLTTAWFAAVLDDAGHPRTPWVHLDTVLRETALFPVELPIQGLKLATHAHVAVVQDMPANPREGAR